MDKEKLLAPRADTPSGLREDDVDVPDMGTVRVRGLSRTEVYVMRTAADNDPQTLDGQRQLVIERKMIATAMLDPAMTEEEVRQWQQAAPAGELEPVTDKITELSALSQGATKSGVPGPGDRAGPGDGALPGGQAGTDGS